MSRVPHDDCAVRLRPLDPADLDTLFAWESTPDALAATDTSAPLSRHLLWEYLKTYSADIDQTRQLRLMIVDNATDEPVGTVDLFNFDPLNNRVEMGLYVAPDYRQRHLGRAAVDAVCRYAHGQLSLKQIYVIIRADNSAALALFDRYGFSRAGTLAAWIRRGGTYHDAIVLQYFLE